MPTTIFAVYVRISSHSQKTDSQKAEISHWLKSQKIPTKQITWFEDKESGRNLKRPAFQKLQQAIFDGKVKTVIVWKLDRLARNHREGINVLADWCGHDVRVVAVTQQIDLKGTIGHVVAGVLFGLAEIELQHTKERQAAGIKVAKKKGIYAGRKAGTMKANPQRARALRKQGMTDTEIANALKVSKSSVYRYLTLAKRKRL